MGKIKLGMVLLILLVLVFSVFSYGGSGPIDQAVPQAKVGVYDTDASFAWGGTPGRRGPTFYKGGSLIKTSGKTLDKDEASGSVIVTETYLEGSTSTWGQGKPKSSTFTFPGTTKNTRSGVDIPIAGSSYKCGDGTLQSSEDAITCASDGGLPGDLGNAERVDRFDKSSRVDSITGEIGSIGGEQFILLGRASSYSEAGSKDNIQAVEYNSPQDSSSSTTWDFTGSKTSKTLNLQTSNVPDFYRPSTRKIKKITLQTKTTEVTATDYDISKNQKEDTSSSGYVYTSCIGSNCSNAISNSKTCTRQGTTKTARDYTLKKDRKKTQLITSQNFYTTRLGDTDFGIKSEKKTWTATIRYDGREENYGTTDYTPCSIRQYTYSCSGLLNCNPGGWTSSYSTSPVTDETLTSDTVRLTIEQVQEGKSKWIEDIPVVSLAKGEGSQKIIVDALFGSERSSINEDITPQSEYQGIVFSGLNDGYKWFMPYTEDKKTPGNQRAQSVSRFDIRLKKRIFAAERTKKKVLEVDGHPTNTKDFLAGVREFSLELLGCGGSKSGLNCQFSGLRFDRDRNRFTNKGVGEVITNLGGVIITEKALENQSALNCESTKCSKVIDLEIRPVDEWKTPSISDASEATSKLTINGMRVDPDESLGACMLTRSLYKSGSMVTGTGSSASTLSKPSLQCTYDYSNGVTPKSTRACGDDVGEMWAYMEGGEVDHSKISEAPTLTQKCTSHGGPHQCIYNGKFYEEGDLKDISETFPFENGTNVEDREICLDMPMKYSDTLFRNGDNGLWEKGQLMLDKQGRAVMDAGGEWYDLDDDRIRNYIKWTDSGPTAPATGNSIDGGWVQYDEADTEMIEPPGSNLHQPLSGLDENGIARTETRLFLMEDDCGPELIGKKEGCDDTGSREKGPVNDDFPVNMFHFSTNSGRFKHMPFEEGARMGEYNHFTAVHNRIQLYDDIGLGGGVVWGDDASNNQSEENPAVSLGKWNNSRIDPVNDEWAATAGLHKAVGLDGGVYATSFDHSGKGGCYNQVETDQDLITKDQRVMANSFAGRAQNSDGETIGVWYDPDYSSNFTDITCDLTQNDYGIGYDTEAGAVRKRAPPGVNRRREVEADLIWDMEDESTVSTSNGYTENIEDKQQFKNMCGDDRNEYLIRNKEGSEQKSPSTTNGGMYACADRPSDCVLDGRIYSEGALVDVSGTSAAEKGSNSPDPEVCLNIDKSGKDGGEFYEIDNESIRSYIIHGKDGTGGNPTNPSTYHVPVRLSHSSGIVWHTNDTAGVQDAVQSNTDYQKISDIYSSPGFGYALEDDCDPELWCDDAGPDEEKVQGVHDLIYSPFLPDIKEDDGGMTGGVAIQTYIGGGNETGDSNGQATENTPYTISNYENDSTIQIEEDNWAIGSKVYDAVGVNGTVFGTGACYGKVIGPEEATNKRHREYANSFAHREDVNSDGNDEGNWVDPDYTNNSVTEGGLSCDLNRTDWGFGYDTGNGLNAYELDANGNEHYSSGNYGSPTGMGTVRASADSLSSWQMNGMAVAGDINFDNETNVLQNGEGQNDLQQHPGACGDDKNEYLIREHHGNSSHNQESTPALTRDNIFVCADRITDCAYNGEVYSEGQWADVSEPTPGDEEGQPINDPEVCLNLSQNIPGGSWYEIDRLEMRDTHYFSLMSTDQWQKIRKYRNTSYWGNNPGTDEGLSSGQADEFTESGYNDKGNMGLAPTGYASEDDCDWGIDGTAGLSACDDVGDIERPADSGPAATNLVPELRWFNAGNFSAEGSGGEGAEQDNYDQSFPYNGVHNRMQDYSDQFEPGAATEENWDSIYGPGYRFTDYEDSTPGPDNWSLSSHITDSVDNFGRSWAAGQCYYRPGPGEADSRETAFPEDLHRTNVSNQSVNKTVKVFGNSFAAAVDIDGDGDDEGAWVDPDDHKSWPGLTDDRVGNFSCDLTGPDRGYGVDNNSGNANYWKWDKTDDKNYQSGNKVVVGDIAFAEVEGKDGPWTQEPDVCGDDNKELLLEEQGEAYNPTERTGRWGCGYRQSNCVARGGSKSIYKPNEYTDADEPGEYKGRLKSDAEICVNRNNPVNDTFGTWYDQDYKKSYCRANTLYGPLGVRWFNPSQIDEHPNAFKEGIDDDLNQYLVNHGHDTVDSIPGSYTPNLNNPDKTPVTAGEPRSASDPDVATKGFCGGDDASEYLVTQDCHTDLCQTDNDVIGVAEDPDKCILDQAKVNGVSGSKRQIYDEGENVTVTRGGVDNTIACFGSEWYSKWPVVFLRDKVKVPKDTEERIAFRVINVLGSKSTFNLELRFKDTAAGKKLDEQTVFQASGTNEMTTTVEAGKSKVHNIVINANQKTNFSKITVYGSNKAGSLSGSDSVRVKVVNGTLNKSFSPGQTRDVPGIQGIHLLFILIMASTLYLASLRQFEV